MSYTLGHLSGRYQTFSAPGSAPPVIRASPYHSSETRSLVGQAPEWNSGLGLGRASGFRSRAANVSFA